MDWPLGLTLGHQDREQRRRHERDKVGIRLLKATPYCPLIPNFKFSVKQGAELEPLIMTNSLSVLIPKLKYTYTS